MSKNIFLQEEKPRHQRVADLVRDGPNFDEDADDAGEIGAWPFAEVTDVIAEQSSKDEQSRLDESAPSLIKRESQADITAAKGIIKSHERNKMRYAKNAEAPAVRPQSTLTLMDSANNQTTLAQMAL